MKFKTNIKCSGCVAAVTPELNNAAGESRWKVDVQNPEKVLTVDADGISSDEIIKAVSRAGYQATEIY